MSHVYCSPPKVMNDSFIIIKCPSLPLLTIFVLKSISLYICVATSDSIGYIFFHSFTFKSFVSLKLKFVSFRQHIVGSFLNTFFQSVTFGWIVSPFTFNAVIDIAGFIFAFLLFVFCYVL